MLVKKLLATSLAIISFYFLFAQQLTPINVQMNKVQLGFRIDYVVEICKRKGLKAVTLDSGFNRIDAHRLYLQKRFQITSLHFSEEI